MHSHVAPHTPATALDHYKLAWLFLVLFSLQSSSSSGIDHIRAVQQAAIAQQVAAVKFSLVVEFYLYLSSVSSRRRVCAFPCCATHSRHCSRPL